MNNPKMLAMIIIVLSVVAASIILAIKNNRRKNAWRELNNAARKLVKEQNLSTALTEGKENRERIRMIISLAWKEQEKQAFVFDPLEGVRIGRQPEINNIVVPDNEVSLSHCLLYRMRNDRNVILEDLGSTNGTTVLHGFRKTKFRKNRVRVYDGDRILVGGLKLELHIFWIDSAYV